MFPADGIPRIWPRTKLIAGKGERWLREDLDQAIDRLTRRRTADAPSRHTVKRPVNWPRYMVERKLATGEVSYYWTPRRKDLKAGFTLRGEALGADYAAAIERAELLNRHLDAWRSGLGAERSSLFGRRFGTLIWMFEQYRRSAAYERIHAGIPAPSTSGR